MSDDVMALASEFEPAERAEWEAAVEKVLRGKSFEQMLVSRTRDGLDIQPLYTAEDATASAVPAVMDPERIEYGWDVRQQHRLVDPVDTNRAIITDLERGVTSVELVAEGAEADQLAEALAGVLFDMAPVALAPHADLDLARSLAGLIVERGDSETTGTWFGLDPLGAAARSGAISDGVGAAALAHDLAPRFPNARTMTADSVRYVEAGATPAQELGWALATGVGYLRLLESAGLSVAQAASTVGFRLSASADQFGTIASLRAFRRAWTRVLDACDVERDDSLIEIQAVTPRSMFSQRDPWVNMLRSTSATLAAVVGGAEAVTVLPHSVASGDADDLARRAARNVQLLLLEESQIARIADPAAGSWFVESLTQRLTEAAWTEFQRVEAGGGMAAALTDGSIQAAVDDAWSERRARLATRAEPVTGVSEFPELDDGLGAADEAQLDTGWPVRRLAAPFEALRDAADRANQRPAVFIAALGSLADHTARSSWITNLLAVGGIEAIGGDAEGAASPIEAEARFVESGCAVAVVCSSDEFYAERAVATVTALKEAGAVLVALAGHPGDMRDEMAAAGIDEFWHTGMDVLSTLEHLHGTLKLDES
jgi:methylmalonyl-CoA mutase